MKNMNEIKWWHQIKLSNGEYTPGEVYHGPAGGNWPNKRFGLPENLTGKKVIDIGAWDGFFSFEAEKNGAEFVLAADAKQEDGGNWGGTEGFNFVKNDLKSKVEYTELNLENNQNVDDIFKKYNKFDVILCYGVLYHLKSPLNSVENLKKLIKPDGILLLETAISTTISETPVLEYRPFFNDDPTNYFYPNSLWVDAAFKKNGAKSVELIWTDKIRSTFRIQF